MTIAKVRIGGYDKPEAHFADGSILSLNAGNTRLMNKCYGVDSDGWIGREIELRLGHVQFQGAPTESIIIAPISAPLTAVELKAAQDRAAAASDRGEMELLDTFLVSDGRRQ